MGGTVPTHANASIAKIISREVTSVGKDSIDGSPNRRREKSRFRRI